MWDPYAEFEKFTLPNALTVYFANWDRPWLKAGIIVHSGGWEDRETKEGTAHFLEHLLIDNVPEWTLSTAKEYFHKIGGYASFGSTYWNGTVYRFSLPLEGDNLVFALDLFGHMCITCKINKFIEREKQVILSEFTESFPARWMFDEILRRRGMIFSGSKLARLVTPMGTQESIISISEKDIQLFYDEHYVPANISIVAIGSLKIQEFVRFIENSPFGLMKLGVRNPLLLATANTDFPNPKETRFIHKISDYKLQPDEHSSVESYVGIPGTIKPEIIKCIRLALNYTFLKEIREKRGWTYGFEATFVNFKKAYEVCISGSFPWASLDSIEYIIDECIAIARSHESKIRNYINGAIISYKIVDLSANNIIDAALDDLRLYHRIKSLKEDKKAWETLKVAEIQDVFSFLSRGRRWTRISYP